MAEPEGAATPSHLYLRGGFHMKSNENHIKYTVHILAASNILIVRKYIAEMGI